jgi:hypothetical protein|nr:MAG TPA: Insulin-like growth factor 1 receptor, IGF1, SIGNALING PROTEIN-HORMONE complex [Caudoviricetes sp.]
MGIKKSELINASDFTALKKLVKSEITRRSNSASVGSMKSYNGTSYDYTTTPAQGKDIKINLEHIQKITKPLDAVTGSNTTPDKNANVIASVLTNATTSVGNLSKIAKDATSTGCKASCSGLCNTGCYGGCKGCSGNCKTNCSGGCNTTCSGCSGGCSGGCDGCEGCGSGCAHTCESCSGCGFWLM